MAVISFRSAESWFVAKYEFRVLLEKAMEYVENESDQYALRQAIYMEGLHFQRLPAERSRQLASALGLAAGDRRQQLLKKDGDQRDHEFAEALEDLKNRLSAIHPELP